MARQQKEENYHGPILILLQYRETQVLNRINDDIITIVLIYTFVYFYFIDFNLIYCFKVVLIYRYFSIVWTIQFTSSLFLAMRPIFMQSLISFDFIFVHTQLATSVDISREIPSFDSM